MSTDFHTPHSFGAPLTSAGVNAPLGELDAAVGKLYGVQLLGADYGMSTGSSDNTAALQAAISAANALGGGTIRIEGGTYTFLSQVTIPGDGIRIMGAGMGATTLSKATADALFINSDTGVTRFGFTVADLTLDGGGSGGAAGTGGAKLENFYDAFFHRVEFKRYKGIGLELRGTGSTYYSHFLECVFYQQNSGCIGVKFSSGAADPNANVFTSCTFHSTTGTTAMRIEGGLVNHLNGCQFEGGDLLLYVNSNYNRFTGNRFESGPVTFDTSATWNRSVGNSYASDVVYTDDGSQNSRVSDFNGGPYRQPSCSARISADTSVAHNAETAIAFDVALLDTPGASTAEKMHSASVNNTKFFCKVAGRYRVTLVVAYAANATGERWARVKLNGSSVRTRKMGPHATVLQPVQVQVYLDLVRNDEIQGFAFQNSGAGLNILSGSDGTVMEIEYIGA